MKKLLLITAAAAVPMMFSLSAHAANGDIAGTIYTTDIKTQVDGLDIQGYAIDGKTLIVLEDLEKYGFTVYYNDNIRSVFITKTGNPPYGFNPVYERGHVGKTAGNYYESDIQAIVNGYYVDSYALDGKSAVCVEDLSETMRYTYDNNSRLLSLNTSLTYDRSAAQKVFYDLEYSNFPWDPSYYAPLHNANSNVWVTHYQLGGVMHSTPQFNVTLANGLHYSAEYICNLYMISISDAVLSPDGSCLYFKNRRTAEPEYKQLELTSMHASPTAEETYISAKNTITQSDFTAVVNNIKIPLYNIGGKDYIRAKDLNGRGYYVSENTQSKSLHILYTGDFSNKTAAAGVSVSGTASPTNGYDVTFNGIVSYSGDYSEIFVYNGECYYPVSRLLYSEANRENVPADTTYRYDIPSKTVYIENYSNSNLYPRNPENYNPPESREVISESKGDFYSVKLCLNTPNNYSDNTQKYYSLSMETDKKAIIDLQYYINRFASDNAYTPLSIDGNTKFVLDKKKNRVTVGDYTIDLLTLEVTKN